MLKTGLPHFVINHGLCHLPSGGNMFIDRTRDYDVTSAIADVISSTKSRDVILLHDEINGGFPANVMLRMMMKLSPRFVHLTVNEERPDGITNAVHLVNKTLHRMNTVTESNNKLRLLMVTNMEFTNKALFKLYDVGILRPILKVLVVHPGWSEELNFINEPMDVRYQFDLYFSLLVRNYTTKQWDLLYNVSKVLKATVNKNELNLPEVYAVSVVYSFAKAMHDMLSQGETSFLRDNHPIFVNSSRLHLAIQRHLEELGSSPNTTSYMYYRNVPSNNSNTDKFCAIGAWRPWTNPKLEIYHDEVTLPFHGRHLVVAAPHSPPYVIFQNANGSLPNKVVEGVFTRLMTFLSKELNFTYSIVRPEDNEWGVHDETTGNWTGGIQLLLARKADILPFLTITRKRRAAVGVSDPIMTNRIMVLLQKPVEPPNTYLFSRPYKTEVWISIVVAVPIMGIVLYSVNKWSPYYQRQTKVNYDKGLFKLMNCIWYVYGAILTQGGEHLPDAISARIVVATWWLFELVVIATYSGNLIAFLAFPQAKWLVKSVEELTSDKTITVLLEKGTGLHQEIQESKIKSLMTLNHRLQNNLFAEVIYHTNKQSERVANGEAVLLGDEYALYRIISEYFKKTNSCGLALAPKSFSEVFQLAVATRLGSPYLEGLNNAIDKLWDVGILEHWVERYFETQVCTVVTTKLTGGNMDVNLKDIEGAFFMLGLGLLCSTLAIFTEVAWNRCCFYKKTQHCKIRFLKRQ
ncbi:putative glutamate receptor isoform X2 [Tachypleus tridentatus]